MRFFFFPVTLWGAMMATLFLSTSLSAQEEEKAVPWSKEMKQFEEADQKAPFPKGGIVFFGSSSVRLWDLPESFPGKKILNRGFGGSMISDSVKWFDVVVARHKPSLAAIYAGDNDIAKGKSPAEVLADFQALRALFAKELPECRFVFLSIKPSPSRAKFREAAREANDLIKKEINDWPLAQYVDLWTCLLGPDGEPDPLYFKEDMLHLNDKGYARWQAVLAPYLDDKGWEKN